MCEQDDLGWTPAVLLCILIAPTKSQPGVQPYTMCYEFLLETPSVGWSSGHTLWMTQELSTLTVVPYKCIWTNAYSGPQALCPKFPGWNIDKCVFRVTGSMPRFQAEIWTSIYFSGPTFWAPSFQAETWTSAFYLRKSQQKPKQVKWPAESNRGNHKVGIWTICTLVYFPDSSVGKEFTCNAGDPDSIPGSGRSAGQGKGYPLQYSGLKNSMDCIYLYSPGKNTGVDNHSLLQRIFPTQGSNPGLLHWQADSPRKPLCMEIHLHFNLRLLINRTQAYLEAEVYRG